MLKKIVSRKSSSKLMNSGRHLNQTDKLRVSNDDNVELSEVIVDSNPSLASRSSTTSIRVPPQIIEPMTYQTDQHINLLMSKSFCGHDVVEDDSTREHVLNAYKFLSSDPLLSPILHIVASSTKVKSVFDFNRDSVHMADPTVPSNTKGMFYLSGRVYIGANQLLDESTKNEVYATLAHEFCHYAIDLTYGNFAKPYAKNDTKTKEEFEVISQKCKLQRGVEEYIDIVYDHYQPEMHHAELIVRVPHLIALYSHDPERLRLIRENFIELFEFFEKKVHPEMQEALPKIEEHDQLKEKEQKILKLRKIAFYSFNFTLVAIIVVIAFTSWFNQPTIFTYTTLSASKKLQIQNSTIIYKNIKVKFLDLFPYNSSAYYALTSNHISQILVGKALDFSDHRFLYLSNLVHHEWQNLTGKLKQKFLTSNFNFQNESLMFEKLIEISPEVFKSLSSVQIVDVLDGKELKVGKMVEEKTSHYIERKFVEVDDDEGLDGKNGVEVEDGSGDMSDNTVEVLVEYNYKQDKMTEMLIGLQEEDKDTTESFIETSGDVGSVVRSTTTKDTTFGYLSYKAEGDLLKNTKTSQEVIEKGLQDRIFILDSEIGAGKTVIFQKFTKGIKKVYPSRWVSFIDLNYKNICEDLLKFNKSLDNSSKKLENNLNSLENNSNNLENNSNHNDKVIENIIEFLGNIVGLDTNNNFEVAIFKESFKLGNLVLLLDNYDQIPPESREIITNLFKLIYNLTKNVQFISSMPLFVKQLRQSLGSHTYQPVPFTEFEQKEFFRSFFSLQSLSNEIIENFTQGAFELSKKLQLDSPLMQKFIAQNYSPESQNLYEICHKFVTQKIENWNESEGGKNLSLYLLSRSSRNFNMMEMYQKVAFQKELDLNLSSNLTKPEFKHFNNLRILKVKTPKILKDEEIARMGIVSFRSESDWSFVHKTLADFFFAKYFIDNLFIIDDKVSETEIKLRNEIFKYLLKNYSRKEMVLTLIRENLKDKAADTKTSKDFIEIINQF